MEPAARHQHSPEVRAQIKRLYARDLRQYACVAHDADGVARWRSTARPALRELLGLETMASELAGHEPAVSLAEAERIDDWTRRLCTIHTEPDVSVEFWLLQPEASGPFPLAVTPHGHEPRGHDTYAGITRGERRRQHKINELDADVAVQAVNHGFVAIAPNTRGFEPNFIPDLNGRHGDRHCRSQFIHAILAGRTGIGERVWDIERIIDWAVELPEVDRDRILVTGNSGGGMATTYAAACDTRITVAVPSCSFCTYIGDNGLAHHCDCNAVPGIYRFGEFSDVAGLIAPRHLLIVNGKQDDLFPTAEVEKAVSGVARIYAAAGVPRRFDHRWGSEGHRFYSDLMWPFIESAVGSKR